MNPQKINKRKLEHIVAIEQDSGVERKQTGFDAIKLIHRALPEINYDDVDTRCSFLGKTLSFPLIISSMTGGAGDEIQKINQNLAIAAEACQVGMGVGSQRVMICDKNARASFSLREHAPTTVLIGNIGAVQLNNGFSIKECRQAVEYLNADGLYLHLNPLQETIQPEGDTNFAGLCDKIAAVNRELSVPILLKEVGGGLSSADITLGMKAGVRIFDLAGRGGTSWSRIESHRDDEVDLGMLFQDWGLTTVEALREAKKVQGDLTVISSGGIRNGIDMIKSVILGAQVCGIAAPFLKPAQESPEAVIKVIERLKKEYTIAMFLMGCQNHDSLKGYDNYIYSTDLANE